MRSNEQIIAEVSQYKQNVGTVIVEFGSGLFKVHNEMPRMWSKQIIAVSHFTSFLYLMKRKRVIL